MAGSTLDVAIPAETALVIDTSVTLAYLAGTEPVSTAAERLFDEFVATGRNGASLSTITVAEVLVRPFRLGQAAIATAEGFLRYFGEIRLVDVNYEVARQAARIRALTNVRMPDALIIATAVAVAADVVVTNDRAWPKAVASVAPELVVCVLDDHRAG